MTTISRVEAQTVAGTDVREVAAAIWEEIIALYDFYGRHFPYTRSSSFLFLTFHQGAGGSCVDRSSSR
jgi:hypothetical protein